MLQFCNSLGCCAQRETTTQTTVETSPVPTKPTIDPTKANPSSETNTAVNETTSTTEPTIETSNESATTPSPTKTPSLNETESPSTEKTPIPSDNSTEVRPVTVGPPKSPILCSAVGLYKLPNDPSNRKYYSCVLKAELMVCPFGQIFDETLALCVNIESTTITTTTETLPTVVRTSTTPSIDWNKYFHCTKEGFFKNPYDCTRFYRCYKNEGDNRHIWLSTFKCPPNQLYDEKLETCDREEDFIRKHGVCQVEPMPTLSSHN